MESKTHSDSSQYRMNDCSFADSHSPHANNCFFVEDEPFEASCGVACFCGTIAGSGRQLCQHLLSVIRLCTQKCHLNFTVPVSKLNNLALLCASFFGGSYLHIFHNHAEKQLLLSSWHQRDVRHKASFDRRRAGPCSSRIG